MSTYLSRTFSGANTSRKIFTISFWLKRTTFGSMKAVISAETTSNFYDQITFASSDQFDVNNVASGSDVISFKTNMKFRDPSAWYHIVTAIDTTQASSSDGVKIYVNGILQTSFGSTTYAQDATFEIGRDGSTTSIGRRQRDQDGYGVGYLSEFYYIDGQQKAATDFGQTDSTTGIWKPKTYSGTYGNNGFKLEFKNSGALGTDTSGNSETFTVNNAGTNAQVVDTPTNNFATMNPIDVGTNLSQTTFSEGDLKIVSSGTTTDTGDQVVSSMGFTKGKWYWEIKGVSSPDNMFWTVFTDVLGGERPYHDNYAYSFYGDGTGSASQIYESQEGNQKGYGTDSNPAFSNNDIIQFAFDCDNYRLYIGKNGLWTDDNAAGGGTITTGSAFNQSTPTGYYQISTAAAQAGVYRFAIVKAGSSVTYTAQVNFGNPPFTIASGNADANGYGNFEYAVPSGYYSLCTENLNTYG